MCVLYMHVHVCICMCIFSVCVCFSCPPYSSLSLLPQYLLPPSLLPPFLFPPSLLPPSLLSPSCSFLPCSFFVTNLLPYFIFYPNTYHTSTLKFCGGVVFNSLYTPKKHLNTSCFITTKLSKIFYSENCTIHTTSVFCFVSHLCLSRLNIEILGFGRLVVNLSAICSCPCEDVRVS